MFYCGIDIAKYKHEAAIIDEAGSCPCERSRPKLLQWVEPRLAFLQ